jgi:hypothetical protein
MIACNATDEARGQALAPRGALRDEASIDTAISTTRLPSPSAATSQVFNRMRPPRARQACDTNGGPGIRQTGETRCERVGAAGRARPREKAPPSSPNRMAHPAGARSTTD